MDQHDTVYFDISRPVSKTLFLKAFEETTFLAQLLTAPFGFSCDAVDVLDRENLLEEFSSIYQSWEDVFSRLIYSKRGIPDDRVAATIHRYLEIKKDPKVLEIIEKAAGAMKSLIEPPNTLELAIPCSHRTCKSAGDVVNTAKTTATLLDQVILATYAAFPHLSSADMTVDSISSSSTLKAFLDNGVDSEIKKTLGISVPIRIMSPSLLGTAAFAPQCFSDQSIEKLVNAMNVSIDIGDGEKTVRRFTLQQYYTLLNLFSESEEVLAVFGKYSTEQSSVCSLEELQNGALGLCTVVHPTIAYVLQLKSIVKKNDDEIEATKASAALYRALGALRGRKEATSAAALGDMHCAIEAVTQALERQYSAEEDEEDKVEEEGDVETSADDAASTSSLLPVYLQLQLLMDRAEYYVEAAKQSDALDDCNAALALDKRCVAAYALRSKLNPPRDLLSKDFNSEEGGVEHTSKVVLKAEVLASAARDALAAFLIGGSSDLSYAAAAEEAARESCRIGARQIFEDRRSVTGPNKAKEILEKVRKDKDSGDIEDSFPRAWLVQSFFAGYESYRTAFGLESMTPEDEIIDEEGDMSEVIKSHYHELKLQAEYKASSMQHTNSNDDSSSSSSSSAVDIDEEVKSSKLKLPLPPAHLTDGEHSLDSIGYWVLRGLVGRLEGTQEPGPEELSVLQASEEKKNAAGHVEMLGSWLREAEKMWADLCAEEGSDDVTDSESSTTDQEEMIEEKAGENGKIDKEYMSMLGRLGLLEDEESDRIVGFKTGLRMGGRGSAQIELPAPDLTKQQYITVSHTSFCTDIVSDFDNETIDYELTSCGAYTVSAGAALTATPFPSSGDRSSDTTATRSATPPSSPPCPAFKWCLELLLLPDVSALTGVTFSPSGTVLDVKPLVPASPEEERAVKEAEKKEEELEILSAKAAEKNSGAKNYSWTRQQVEKEEEEDDEGWEDCDDDDEEENADDDGEWEDCDNEDEVDEVDCENEEEEEEEGAEEKEIADLRKNIRGVKMGWCADKALPKDKPKDKPNDKAAPAPAKKIPPAPVPVTVPVVKSFDPQAKVDSAKGADVPAPMTTSIDTTITAPVSATEDPLTVSVTASATASPALQEPSASVVTALGSDVAPAATATAAAVTVTDADADAAISSKAAPLSRSLHACLLSVCSSIAYLSGDALGAVKCLRASIQENITAGGTLVDSSVKLGSLLIDMDQLEEAETILNNVQKVNPTAVAYLHQAELQIHKNDFHSAVKLLMKAQKAMIVKDLVPYNPYYQDRDLNVQNLTAEEIAAKRAKRSRVIERRRVLSMSLERQLSATIFALLGVAQFRCVPTSPEIALRTLQEGIVKFPENLYLLICTGEIMSQAGDAVKAIKCFKRANRQSPLHPLPYVNAARTYVQLNQPKKAFLHLSTAIRLDQFSSSTRVDLSQIYLLSGRTELALSTLQEALDMAKHVSEIRDVLTALKVAEIQMELQREGVYYPPAEMAAV